MGLFSVSLAVCLFSKIRVLVLCAILPHSPYSTEYRYQLINEKIFGEKQNNNVKWKSKIKIIIRFMNGNRRYEHVSVIPTPRWVWSDWTESWNSHSCYGYLQHNQWIIYYPFVYLFLKTKWIEIRVVFSLNSPIFNLTVIQIFHWINNRINNIGNGKSWWLYTVNCVCAVLKTEFNIFSFILIYTKRLYFIHWHQRIQKNREKRGKAYRMHKIKELINWIELGERVVLETDRIWALIYPLG